MNIGIIIHSQTGNTSSVAMKLQEKLTAAGHDAVIEQLKVVGELKPGAKNIQFDNLPEIEQYDAIVFGSPVQGFALNPVMNSYLAQASIKNKKIGCLITQFFPYPWMGGNRAVKQMKALCEEKGALVGESAIINWSSPQRQRKIVEGINRLSSYLSSNY